VARTFTALKNITIAKVDVLQYPEAFDRYALHGTPLMVCVYGKGEGGGGGLGGGGGVLCGCVWV